MNQTITTSEFSTVARGTLEPPAFLNKTENQPVTKIPGEISAATGVTLESTAFLNSLHQQFLTLGRERHKITYKLLALLPQIYKEKVYEAKGFATIYEYAGKLAGLSHSTVEKALKLDEKLRDKPLLQKAIETQGVHKIAIIASLATPENEKMFADKVENIV
jgi:hypothetical protein